MTMNAAAGQPSTDLNGIVGQHLIYSYENGWQYEMYVKNRTTIDYRIHSGMVGGRWVKHQAVELVRLAQDVYKVVWTEPTGTSVCVTVMPGQRRVHGVAFFPRWVHDHPERTVLFQNEHLPTMERYREQGPTYPIHILCEVATINFIEHVGCDDETVIDCPPNRLPDGYADRRN